MFRYLGQGIIVFKAMLVLIMLLTVLVYGYKLSFGSGVCIGSIEAAKGLYSSTSKDGRWSEINKYRSDIVTCYQIMEK